MAHSLFVTRKSLRRFGFERCTRIDSMYINVTTTTPPCSSLPLFSTDTFPHMWIAVCLIFTANNFLTSEMFSVHHLWSYLSRFYSAKVLFIPSSLFLAVYPTFLYCTFICSPIFVLFGFLLYLPVSRQSSFH